MGETDPTVVRQVKLSDLGPRKPRTYSKNTKPKPVAMAPKKRRFADVTVIRDGLQDEAKVERLTVKRDVTRTDRTAEEAKLLLSELAGGE
jgi:hypothetical protein